MPRLLLLSCMVLACSPTVKRSINIVPLVGETRFACGQTYRLGTPATDYRPRDLRLYLHDVVVVDAHEHESSFTLETDGTWQTPSVALLDFEDATGDCRNGTSDTHTTLVGSSTATATTALRFSLGVPPALNHQDATAAQAPLNSTAMFWSWLGGYKYLRLEGLTTGLPMGHDLHVGAVGCSPGALPNSVSGCAADNVVRVTVAPFDLERDDLAIDLVALFDGSDLNTNTPDTAPGCMSASTDSDCAPLFERLGLPFGSTNAMPQRVFRRR